MSRNPYADVLRVPGAAAFSAAGGLARLPNAMVGIGTVLMVQEYTGSYGLAGRVSAVLVVAQALAAPQVARFVDRAGQRRVLLPLLVVTTAGLIGLVAAAGAGAPEPVLLLIAAIAGASQGSYGSYVRARWTHAVHDPGRLHTAFSLEAVVDEVAFIIGPIAATVLATAVIPAGGLLVAALAGAAGGFALLVQRRTEPPVRRSDDGGGVRGDVVGRARDGDVVGRTGDGGDRPADGPGRDVVGEAEIDVVTRADDGTIVEVAATTADRRSAILMPGIPGLALVFLAMGTIFGAVDVSTVAFASEQGARGLAGVILAAFALGSMLSGLVYGAVHWQSRLSTRFAVGTAALAVGVSLFLTAQSKVALAVAMCVTGVAIAPTLINGNAMVQSLVPANRLTEGLAWIATATGGGAALGSWLAGTRIDDAGSQAGFWVAMIAGWTCAVMALVSLPTLRRR
ncbi:major facilitator superfamily MFS_1 [Xylanimonas cellulosilytica DSM 15894]|uniref:Major facilitator superfamily MFS_1 n=1 Tax=Xylanimonas cellulosilytica (strain DSM 15894 / JCM 12276 / CECT 5975 / KCTC 9989 / LMG 20990 / NBRC 107835 / XIL07) TaxID=446471 RepID=D1BU38_XYLCX|nr:MFS transporter [Xylanimonas cellulosilytica]ACZ29202.1 major facilitator superfamily MFS_1 [Xylanimonas cellulosilytica DSM 15894]